MKRLKIIVYGRVQRVGYRDAVAELARKIGIKGTVRNLEDEVSVEIIAEGEEKHLDEFLKLIKIRGYTIEVEKIDVCEEKATDKFKYFKILRGEPNEELGERIDVAGNFLYKMLEKQDQMLGKQDQMLEKQDQMLGKQDQMLEKQDQMLGKQDQMLEKQDQMLGKQDQTIKKLDEFHKETIGKLSEFHKDTVNKFDVMEQKYGKISIILERISTALEVLAGIKSKYSKSTK